MILSKYDKWRSSLNLTKSEETALIYHTIDIADHVDPNDIARHIISPIAAWNVVSNDDDMWHTALSCNPAPKDLAYQAIINDRDNIHKLAYMLAYEQPELATQLFNELEYYRLQGRI